jgi:hypothetical protein
VNAAHLLMTHDHGTPDEIVRLAHETFPGGIDLDPASHPKWNERIKARRILTEEDDARVAAWFPDAPLPLRLKSDRRIAPPSNPGEVVFCNPPNDKKGALVAFFWKTIVEYWLRGYIRSAVYVGFNVEQLSRLQRIGARTSPLRHPTVTPSHRPEYLSGATLRPQGDPAHASFVTLLSNTPSEVRTFCALGKELGDVTGPLI